MFHEEAKKILLKKVQCFKGWSWAITELEVRPSWVMKEEFLQPPRNLPFHSGHCLVPELSCWQGRLGQLQKWSKDLGVRISSHGCVCKQGLTALRAVTCLSEREKEKPWEENEAVRKYVHCGVCVCARGGGGYCFRKLRVEEISALARAEEKLRELKCFVLLQSYLGVNWKL